MKDNHEERFSVSGRPGVDEKARQTPGLYAYAAGGVNLFLMQRGIPMGPRLHGVVHRNLDAHRNDGQSQCSSHAGEVKALLGDGAEALGAGRYGTAAVNFGGAVLNSLSFFAAGAVDHQKTKGFYSAADRPRVDDLADRSYSFS